VGDVYTVSQGSPGVANPKTPVQTPINTAGGFFEIIMGGTAVVEADSIEPPKDDELDRYLRGEGGSGDRTSL